MCSSIRPSSFQKKPPTYIHMTDVTKLNEVIRRLADADNSPVIVESNLDVMMFIDNDITKTLLWVLCILSILNAARLLARPKKKSPRKKP